MVRNDPPLYYERHIFVCTNERPEGHPRGCCEAGGATKLRNYMKARAKEMGLKGVRVNNSGCLDRCELGPTLVIGEALDAAGNSAKCNFTMRMVHPSLCDPGFSDVAYNGICKQCEAGIN